MLIEELEEQLDELFPNGFAIEKLDNGEIVIYTGLVENDDSELIPLDTEEDADYDPDLEPFTEEDDDDDD